MFDSLFGSLDSPQMYPKMDTLLDTAYAQKVRPTLTESLTRTSEAVLSLTGGFDFIVRASSRRFRGEVLRNRH